MFFSVVFSSGSTTTSTACSFKTFLFSSVAVVSDASLCCFIVNECKSFSACLEAFLARIFAFSSSSFSILFPNSNNFCSFKCSSSSFFFWAALCCSCSCSSFCFNAVAILNSSSFFSFSSCIFLSSSSMCFSFSSSSFCNINAVFSSSSWFFLNNSCSFCNSISFSVSSFFFSSRASFRSCSNRSSLCCSSLFSISSLSCCSFFSFFSFFSCFSFLSFSSLSSCSFIFSSSLILFCSIVSNRLRSSASFFISLRTFFSNWVANCCASASAFSSARLVACSRSSAFCVFRNSNSSSIWSADSICARIAASCSAMLARRLALADVTLACSSCARFAAASKARSASASASLSELFKSLESFELVAVVSTRPLFLGDDCCFSIGCSCCCGCWWDIFGSCVRSRWCCCCRRCLSSFFLTCFDTASLISFSSLFSHWAGWSKALRARLLGRLLDRLGRAVPLEECPLEDALDAVRTNSAISVIWSFVERACSDTTVLVWFSITATRITQASVIVKVSFKAANAAWRCLSEMNRFAIWFNACINKPFDLSVIVLSSSTRSNAESSLVLFSLCLSSLVSKPWTNKW